MVDHAGTETQNFDCNSLLPDSSLASGNRKKLRIADEHQHTTPLDDTVVLESPSIETQLENFNIDTGVMDTLDCIENLRTDTVDGYEKEVVLDSDDDTACNTKVTSVFRGLFCQKTKAYAEVDSSEMEKRHPTPGEECYMGNLQRPGGRVCVQSLWAPGSAFTDVTNKGSNSGPSLTFSNILYQRKCGADSGLSKEEDHTFGTNVKQVDDNHDDQNLNSATSRFMVQSRSRDMVRKFTRDAFDMTEVLLANYETQNGQTDTSLVAVSDHEPARLSYVESQQPGQLSQTSAMAFVDHYLSACNINLSDDIKIGMTNKTGSPPNLIAKGPHCLARRANFKTSSGKSDVFDWVDKQFDDEEDVLVRERNKLILDSKESGLRYVDLHENFGNLNFEMQKKLEVQSKEKLQETTKKSVDNPNESSVEVQIPERKPKANCAKEQSLVQQMENSGFTRDVLDMSDVGFDTQVAAEAMEALLYVPPPIVNANCAQQCPERTLEGCAKGSIMNNASKHCSFTMGASFNLGVTVRQSKRTKRKPKMVNENIFAPLKKNKENEIELDPQLTLQGKVTGGMNSTNARKRLRGRLRKVISQQKEEGCPGRKNIKENGENVCSSKSIKFYSLNKGQSSEKPKNFSPVDHQTRHQPEVNALRRSNDSIYSFEDRMNDVMEVDDFRKQRKKCISETNASQLFDVEEERSSTLSSDTSGKAVNNKVDQQVPLELNVAVSTGNLKLELWHYPKGQRRHKNVVQHPTGDTSRCTNFAVVEEKIGSRLSFGKNKKSKGSSKSTCFSFDVEKKARSFVYTRHLSSSETKCRESLLCKSFCESSCGDTTDSAVTNEKIVPTGIYSAEVSWHSDKQDNVMLTCSGGRAENAKGGKDMFQNGNVKALFVSKNGETCKQPPKRKLWRPPALMNELIRLGYAESLPDFVSKDLRRRRSTANVCVLFSQNLGGDLIKQQKKILARLGFSIASSCSDSTHFIADRFVRTRNMLETIALGKPVVTHLWLDSCAQASCFIDEKNYILRDAKKEKEIGFSMPVTLVRASQQPLLKGQRVFITPNVKPGKELIESLVKAVHGQVVENIERTPAKDEMIPGGLIILSCEQDYEVCVSFLEEGMPVYCPEILLNGIVIQKLEYGRHRLFTNSIERACINRRPREK